MQLDKTDRKLITKGLYRPSHASGTMANRTGAKNEKQKTLLTPTLCYGRGSSARLLGTCPTGKQTSYAPLIGPSANSQWPYARAPAVT